MGEGDIHPAIVVEIENGNCKTRSEHTDPSKTCSRKFSFARIFEETSGP